MRTGRNSASCTRRSYAKRRKTGKPSLPRRAEVTNCGSLQDSLRIAVVDQVQHVRRQIYTVQQGRRRWTARLGLVVRIGDRAGAFPGALPERALTPVATDIVLPDQAVTGH